MTPSAFVVHDLEQAKAALKAARERGLCVLLVSAKGAAATLGPAVWREMIAAAEKAEPGALAAAILDCGNDPGFALAALREGVKAIRVGARPEVRAKLADIAGQRGATLMADRPDPVCDLSAAPDFLAKARDWLSRA
ncbi:MAG: hypothetical protein AAB543_09565 [Pseudomonadota bacterium]